MAGNSFPVDATLIKLLTDIYSNMIASGLNRRARWKLIIRDDGTIDLVITALLKDGTEHISKSLEEIFPLVKENGTPDKYSVEAMQTVLKYLITTYDINTPA
jgi:hypothetical protein